MPDPHPSSWPVAMARLNPWPGVPHAAMFAPGSVIVWGAVVVSTSLWIALFALLCLALTP